MKSTFRVWAMAAATVVLVTACGGGGGGGGNSVSTIRTGTFSDSPVGGLTYVIRGVSSKTDATGHFNYVDGDTVTFKVGDIVIGSALAKPIVTPVSLVSGAADEMNATVTNIAKFLQTIDDDSNPSNGIQLTNAIHNAAIGRTINFAQTTGAYDADAAVTAAYVALGGHVGVTDGNAQSHLQGNLFAAIAGTYTGTYSGSGTGTFNFAVNSTGTITSGTIYQEPSHTPITIAGNIASSGAFSSIGNAGTLNGTAVTLNFVGSIDLAASTVSGTWTVTGAGINFTGPFTGHK